MTTLWQFLTWLALGFLSAFLGVSLWLDSELAPVAIPSMMWILPAALAMMVLAIAWPVRSAAGGKRGRVNPLTAARIAIFCQACCRGGALLGGIALGSWAALSGRGEAVFLDIQAGHALRAGLASVALAGAGWLGEWWCAIDDDDESAASGQSA
ncbi:MAG: DUF3180 domain-containing protein [Flaviflexus sp.]|nr:DUF3180 domain-containing protein [Flaviflexus sp.]